MDIFDWIIRELEPEQRTSEALLYEHMESQSGRSLPIIYQPFDAGNVAHWRDRGAAHDFLFATKSQGKRVLDFGPGDGWPSLIIAPFVDEVVGVEGSRRRIEVCRRNAKRLGVSNATFEYVEPGGALPFPDASFDAVVAASSVEQTPDPRATLIELYRVLKPGGRLRIFYEALGRYRNRPAQSAWLWPTGDTTRLVLSDMDIDHETVRHIVLTYGLLEQELAGALGCAGEIDVAKLDSAVLDSSRRHLIESGMYTLRHPSGPTLQEWLLDVGFGEVHGTHSAIFVAGMIFNALPEAARPKALSAVDDYLRPIAAVAVELPAPLDRDPMITAVK
jgi:ubiquinone/menaquinone biosynthesis C-methylase UbiE